MAAPDLSTKITGVAPTLYKDPSNQLVAGFAVTYMVGANGPYTVTLPAAGFTAAAAKQAVEKMAMEIRGTLS